MFSSTLKRKLLTVVAVVGLSSAAMTGQAHAGITPSWTNTASFSSYLAGSTTFKVITENKIRVDLSNMRCTGCASAPYFYVSVENNVCGFWGCSWKNRGTKTVNVNNGRANLVFSNLPSTTTSWRVVFTNQAPGTNTKTMTVGVW